jgi:hypothetical protein
MLEEDDLTSDYEKKLGLFESKIDPVKENSSVESDHSNEKVYLTPKIANSKKDIT